MKNLKIKYAAILFMIMLTSSMTHVKATPKNDFSKWEKKRPMRSKTLFIVLHTTEAGNESSLASVKRSGTCNYLVDLDGTVHLIISDNKLAKHAGRSMWNRFSDLSRYSIGIETVGWHNRKPTLKQLIALKALLTRLKKKYRLSDDKVVTHCMVAYGSPNKWYKFKHRGRKRCGMFFATKEIRQKLGLKNVFHSDPDVKARRLKIADTWLWKFIFGPQKKVLDDEEKEERNLINEDKEDDDEGKFEGFREVTSKNIENVAGDDYRKATTIYFFPSGTIRTGKEIPKKEFATLPKGTKVLVGYIYGGKISKNRSAYKIAGKRWNLPSTFYRLPDGTIKNGDDIEDDKFPLETIVFYMD